MPFVKGAAEGYVRVTNPLAENEAYLRRDLLETLALRAEYNLAHMQRDVRHFEIGDAFRPGTGALPVERLHVAALIMGHRRPPHWTEGSPPDFDEWDAKGLGEEMARTAYPSSTIELKGAHPQSSNGSGHALWEIVVDEELRGIVTRLKLDAPVWAAPAFGIELLLVPIDSDMVAPKGEANYGARESKKGSGGKRGIVYRSLPTTPAAEFDLALLVPNDLPAATVERVIQEAGGELLERVVMFDEYRGDKVPSGYRSLAWRLTLRHPERTLREKEIAGRREKLLRTLEGELGVRQRTT
jgi:phenylalanyl-tRNA synthetase beta chain